MAAMSAAADDALILLFTVLLTLLLAVTLVQVLRLPALPALTLAAEQDLGARVAQFKRELRASASASARATRRKKVDGRDVRAEYRRRRKLTRKVTRVLRDPWYRDGEMIYALASFGFTLPPFFPLLPMAAVSVAAAASVLAPSGLSFL